MHVLSGHEDSVNSATFSHDGRLLASASTDRAIKLWNLESGRAVHTLEGRIRWGVGVEFSSDDRQLVSARGRWNRSGQVAVYDTHSGEQLSIEDTHDDYMTCLAISPDGNTWATGGWDHRVILWDAALAKPIADLGKHDSAILDVAFAPDGVSLVSASADHTLKLWNVAERQVRFTLSGHAGEVTCVGFSPDAARVVSGGNDGVVKVWSAQTGQLLASVVGHAEQVTGVAFDHNGETLTTASADGTLKQWDLADVLEGAVLRGHERAIYALAFSPDGKTLASGGYDSTLRFWDVESQEQTAQVDGEFGRVTSVVFSADGASCYSAHRYSGPNLRKWSVEPDQVFPTDMTVAPNVAEEEHPRTSSIEAAALSPVGDLMALLQRGGQVTLWNTSTRQSHVLWTRNVAIPGDVAFSPDGNRIATIGDDRVVRILNSATGQLAAEFQGHTSSITSVDFSPDGKLLASGGDGPDDSIVEYRNLPAPKNTTWAQWQDPLGCFLAQRGNACLRGWRRHGQAVGPRYGGDSHDDRRAYPRRHRSPICSRRHGTCFGQRRQHDSALVRKMRPG